MLRTILTGIALLHLGPGIAFLLLAFGCDGAEPALGQACRGGIFETFGLFTLASWLVIGAAWGALALVRRRRCTERLRSSREGCR
jgi:hypothetical protein